jgi:hypothetical protein
MRGRQARSDRSYVNDTRAREVDVSAVAACPMCRIVTLRAGNGGRRVTLAQRPKVYLQSRFDVEYLCCLRAARGL